MAASTESQVMVGANGGCGTTDEETRASQSSRCLSTKQGNEEEHSNPANSDDSKCDPSEKIVQGEGAMEATGAHCTEGSSRGISQRPPPRVDLVAPRILWTYWDQGADAMPAFNKLCVDSWKVLNPTWCVEVVDRESLRTLVEHEDLPRTLDALSLHQHRADCAKLALLRRHGGVYLDSSVLVFADLATVMSWLDIEEGRLDFSGFYLRTHDFVENWFMACRQESPLVVAWHEEHLAFWQTRTDMRNVEHDPFFRGVCLRHIREWERNYLAQHACYKKLLDWDTDGFRELASRARLEDAAQTALWLLHQLEQAASERAKRSEARRVRKAKQMQAQAAACVAGEPVLSWGGPGSSCRYKPQLGPPRAGVRSEYLMQVDCQREMESMLLREDSAKLWAEVEQRQIPLLKFTGHVGFLGRFNRLDFLEGKSTLQRLFQKALGLTQGTAAAQHGARLDGEDAELVVWEVVGGQGTAGILVRVGSSLTSEPAAGDMARSRISTGALVKQLRVEGLRLHYELLAGTGPSSGWVSIEIPGKKLLAKTWDPQSSAPCLMACGPERCMLACACALQCECR
mmetsp:Transcript_93086/g.216338  ORF Transcript_93086/g.216338 Transcript_93086/m.216338 type:complete len:571 (-) Transcript_93086:22-1734(-)